MMMAKPTPATVNKDTYDDNDDCNIDGDDDTDSDNVDADLPSTSGLRDSKACSCSRS